MAVIINYLDILARLLDKYNQGRMDDKDNERFIRLYRWYDNDI